MSNSEEYTKMWKENIHPWHISGVNPYLNDFFTVMTHGEKINGKQILVPLCGKCVDLKFFYERGLAVVGIEWSEIAINSFFQENGFSYSVEEKVEPFDYKIYRHDERLQVLQCDLFKANQVLPNNTFDFWWDVAALVAILPEDRKLYLDHLCSLLRLTARGLVECLEYDPTVRSGPPHIIATKDFKNILNGRFEIQELSRKTEGELPAEYTARLVNDVVHALYLVQRIE